MDHKKHAMPTAFAFWLLLAFIATYCATAKDMSAISTYVTFLGQLVFDLVATIFCWKLVARSQQHDKFGVTLLAIALVMLTLSDFFYHTIVNVKWFPQMNPMVFNVTLLLFFLFAFLGFAKTFMSHKASGHHPLLSVLAILFGIMALLLAFYPNQQASAMPTMNIVTIVLSVLAVVCGFLAMPRVNAISFNIFAVGATVIFLSNLMFTLQGSHPVTSARGLEILWMLGSMQMAAGAYLRFKGE